MFSPPVKFSRFSDLFFAFNWRSTKASGKIGQILFRQALGEIKSATLTEERLGTTAGLLHIYLVVSSLASRGRYIQMRAAAKTLAYPKAIIRASDRSKPKPSRVLHISTCSFRLLYRICHLWVQACQDKNVFWSSIVFSSHLATT